MLLLSWLYREAGATSTQVSVYRDYIPCARRLSRRARLSLKTGHHRDAPKPSVPGPVVETMRRPHLRVERIPMGRTGEIEEVASLVAWLASSECSFSTGATFDISGGRADVLAGFPSPVVRLCSDEVRNFFHSAHRWDDLEPRAILGPIRDAPTIL